jgi:glycosyltransferase involved in cell wall biosynthesis
MYLSCIVPAKNEAGHLHYVLSQILSIVEINDIIIIEGGSNDKTFEVASEIANAFPEKVKLLKQGGQGKFNAVITGAKHAKNSSVLIWDSDGTVPLHSTKKVIAASKKSYNMIIGNRLMGEMEPGSMQYSNFLGNWLFAFIWAPLLDKNIVDLLCGTKIIPRKLFLVIPSWLLKIDPYGDFALIATAKVHGVTIESISVDYLKRKYGTTNIHRWSGGLRLLIATLSVYLWLFFRNIKNAK